MRHQALACSFVVIASKGPGSPWLFLDAHARLLSTDMVLPCFFQYRPRGLSLSTKAILHEAEDPVHHLARPRPSKVIKPSMPMCWQPISMLLALMHFESSHGHSP
jgi:hypothetical protein